MAAGSFRVKAMPNSRVLELSAESPDPAAAAAFLNSTAKEFISSGLEARFRSNRQTGDWLNGQLSELKTKLTMGENSLLDYSRREGLVLTGGGKDKENVADDRLLQLQRELSSAHADRVAKQARFESAATAVGGPLPETVETDLLRFHHEKISDLRRQLSELGATMKPTHYKVVKVQEQIKTLEAELDKARKQVVERVKNDFEAAVLREKLLLGDYEAQTLVVRDQAAKSTYYGLLKREVDTTRQLYDSLLQKVKEADVAAALRSPGSRIIDRAEKPESPFRPSWTRNASLGLAAGLALGLLLALTREQLSDTFHQPGDIELALRVPELGVVPAERPRSMQKSLARLGAALDQTGLQVWQVERTLKNEGRSLLAESVRNTLTSILSVSRSGSKEPRVIVVTSAGAGEGKTTLVCNLAMAFAEAGRKTVLIDADMRRPRIHGVFGISNDRGLSTVLKAAEQLDTVETTATDVPGLFLLPSGPADPALGNLLHSPRFPELLAKLRQAFDIVLIDTPPVLLVADARVAGAHADGALLVIRAGDTSREAAGAARRRLEDDSIPILGAVLNGWDPSAGTHYGYRSYGRYYARTYGKA